MSHWPILLRAVLSVSLIFNGSGVAMASSHAPDEDVSIDAKVVPPNAALKVESLPPCHQHADHELPAPARQPFDAPVLDLLSDAGDDTDDCCDAGACGCGCLHQTNAAVPTYLARAFAAEHPSTPPALKRDHAAPVLPHLIRPPII